MGREDPQLKLRLTEEMKDRVAAAARQNNRSVNAEIIARLEGSFDGEQKLWDELNRISETMDALSQKMDRIEPKVEGLWRREGT